MAVSWPFAPTAPRSMAAVPSATPGRAAGASTTADAEGGPTAQVRAVALSPVTGLVVMLLGLALLFVLPPVGLPFVALVVLPAVIYHLRAERRLQYHDRRG